MASRRRPDTRMPERPKPAGTPYI